MASFKRFIVIFLWFLSTAFNLANASTSLGNGVDYIPTTKSLAIGTTSANEKITINGSTAAVSLREGSAASNTSSYGKLYVKSSDSCLYFMHDGGVESQLTNNGAGLGTYKIDDLSDAIHNSTSTYNLFMGSGSGSNANAETLYNTALGYQALNMGAIVNGDANTALGYQALKSNTFGNGNTAAGYKAGYANTTGSGNISVGYQAGDNITTGSNNITIGYDVDAVSAVGSNQLNIGNTIYGDLSNDYVGIGDSSPTNALTITGAASTSGVLQVGQETATTYSRFGAGATGHTLNAANDLLISDDFEVDDDAYFDDTITVAGAATLSSTLAVTSTTTASADVILSGTSANIRLGSNYLSGDGGDEGISIDSSGNMTISGTGTITGNTILASVDIGGGTGSTGVTISSAGAVTIDGATAIGNNSATVAINSSDWDIDATGAATGLGAITADGNFTLSGSSANIILGSNYLSGDGGDEGVSVDGSGNVTFSGTVSGGATTVSSLNVSDGNITNVGDIALDSISSDASTTIAITLGTDPGDDLLVNGNTLVVEGDNSRVGINDDSPDYLLDVNGTLGVYGAATLSSTLAVSSNTTVGGTLGVTGNSTLASVDIGGGYGSTGATISSAGALSVDGATTLASTLAVIGTTSFTGATTHGGNITITKADPSTILNTTTAGDTDFWIGVQEDAGGDDDDVFQIGDGTSPGTNAFLTINTTGNVGIGSASPTQALDVTGSVTLQATTSSSTNGIIYKGGLPFIHNFKHSTGSSAIPVGDNLFMGEEAGNLTTGSTATSTIHGSYNAGIGYRSLYSNTTGYKNAAIGSQSLYSNTTGNNNTASGTTSLYSNTTGYNNSAVGSSSLYGNTTGYSNSALGFEAGRYIADGSTANQTSNTSIYIGNSTKALADGDTNEVVIGYNATGIGSNSVVLGNDSITKTALKGNVGLNDTSPDFLLDVNGTLGVAGAATLSSTLAVSSNTTIGGTLGVTGNSTLASVDVGGGYGSTGVTISSAGVLQVDGATTLASTLAVTGTTTFTGGTTHAGNPTVTKADPSVILNTTTATDTDFWIGVQEDAGGDDDDKFQIGDGTSPGTNAFLTIDTAGNVGIGSASPTQELDIVGDINLQNTTSNDTGIIYKAGLPFIHNFKHPTGGGATPDGYNTFAGEESGNLSMGSTATQTYHGSYNTGIGYRSLYSSTTGYRNSAFGASSLYSNTTGYDNTAGGFSSLYSNSSGYYNTALGSYGLYANTTGYYNTAIGYEAGRYITDGSTANQTSNTSLYIGAATKALANGDQNEIVIGYNATGVGNNSVVLGNDSITATILKGNVGLNDTTPDYLLDVNGTLGVAGAATLSSTLAVTSNVTVGGTLGVTGNSTLASVDIGGGTGSTGVTITSAGAVTIDGQTAIGNNSATVAVNSSDWDISTTGAMTGIGAITADGMVTLSGTAANIALGSNYLSGDGGDEGLSVDSSGNVSFSGTLSVGAMTATSLSVSDGNITNVGDIALDSISSDASTSIAITLGTDANDDLMVNGNTLVVQGDTSNVGINIANPAYQLHVNGTFAATSNSTIGGTFNVTGNSTLTSVDIGGGTGSTGVTITSAGAVTIDGQTAIGNNSATVAINSSDWDIDVTGAATGLGAITADGNFTLSGTAANIILGSNYLSGDGGDEGVSVDSSGNVTISGTGTVTGNTILTSVDIGGGTGSTGVTISSAGAVTIDGQTAIGNNSATVAINSSDWDISATGDATGLGAITADGHFTLSGSAANIALGSNYLSGDGGDEGISVDSSGNVTISGTTNFSGATTHTGNATITKADPSVVLNVTTATDTDFWLGVQDDAGGDDDDKFQIGDGSTPGTNAFFTIDTSGNVGINSTSPAVKLDIVGPSSAFTQLNVTSGSQNNNQAAGISLTNTAGSYGLVLYKDASAASYPDSMFIGPYTQGKKLHLGYGNAAAQATLDTTAGNFGINDTTPDYLLDDNGTLGVAGAATLSSTLAVSSNTTVGGTLGVTGNSTLASVDIGGGYGSTGATVSSAGVLQVDGATTLASTLGVTGTSTFASTLTMSGTGANIRLGSNYLSGDGDDEGVYIDSAGNVGIGGAPNERFDLLLTTTSGGNFQLGTYNYLGIMKTSGASFMGWNAKVDTSTADQAVVAVTNALGYNFMKQTNTGIEFHTGNGSVTAGNAASSQRMIIHAAGNVGINDSTPDFLLDVNGTLGVAGAATLASTLSVAGTSTFVGAITHSGNITVTKADPSVILDTTTATDTDFWMGVQEDAGGDDDDYFQIGDGTSPGTNTFVSINTSGNVGIGTATPGAILHLTAASTNPILKLERSGSITTTWDMTSGYNNIVSTGLFVYSDSSADTTAKSFRMGAKHYTNAEEPMGIIFGYATAGSNSVSIGGGTSYFNAATSISFFTAADNTTTTGTERMIILPGGNIGIYDTTPDFLLDDNGTLGVAGAATFASTVAITGATTFTGATTHAGDITITKADPSVILNTTTATDTDFWVGVQEDAGSDDDDKFQIGDGTSPGTNAFFTIDTSGNVGIGSASPSQELDIVGDINLETTTSNDTGIIYKAGTRFIHDFHHPTGGGAVPTGGNTFVGVGSGNLTTGSTATQTYHGSSNTGIGSSTLTALTTGYYNTAVGYSSLSNTTTGYINTAMGNDSLSANTSGYANVAIGYAALTSMTTGYVNTALGYQAGRYITDGATANQTSYSSIYLGANTKALADGDTNEIVIGYNATGAGSNTVVLGNDSITATVLKGNVGLNDTTPDFLLDDNGTLGVAGAATLSSTLAVTGTTTLSSDMILSGTSANIRLGSNWLSGDGGDEGVYVTSAGNIGIGTTSPSSRVSVYGTSYPFFLVEGNNTTRSFVALEANSASNNDTSFLFTSNGTLLFNSQAYADRGTTSNATTRMSINGSSGNVGIGTATATTLLHVESSSSPTIKLFQTGGSNRYEWSTDGTNSYIADAANGVNSLTLTAGGGVIIKTNGNVSAVTIGTQAPVNSIYVTNTAGNVGIGTATVNSKMHIYGSDNDVLLLSDGANCEAQPDTGALTWSCSSDARLKTNIRPAMPIMDDIMKFKLKEFTFIPTNTESFGVIAQEVQEDFPELVTEGEDGFLRVSEINHWKLIKALQELETENEANENTLAEMKALVCQDYPNSSACQ